MRIPARLLLTAGMLLLPFAGVVFGQPGPPIGGPPPCWPPPCIPIDGGVGFLLAAGALIGGRKLLQARKPDNSPA